MVAMAMLLAIVASWGCPSARGFAPVGLRRTVGPVVPGGAQVRRHLFLPEGWDASAPQENRGSPSGSGGGLFGRGRGSGKKASGEGVEQAGAASARAKVARFSGVSVARTLHQDGFFIRQVVFIAVMAALGVAAVAKGIPCHGKLAQLVVLNAALDAVATAWRQTLVVHTTQTKRKIDHLEHSMQNSESVIIDSNLYASVRREYDVEGHYCVYLGNGKWSCR